MDFGTQFPEPQEYPLQERAPEAPSDSTRPAGQVIAEQSLDAEPHSTAPCFIP